MWNKDDKAALPETLLGIAIGILAAVLFLKSFQPDVFESVQQKLMPNHPAFTTER